jgi:hypothetical protein
VALFSTPKRGAVVYNFEAVGTDGPGAYVARGTGGESPDEARALLAYMVGGDGTEREDDVTVLSGEASPAEIVDAVTRLAPAGGTLYVAPGTVITQ